MEYVGSVLGPRTDILHEGVRGVFLFPSIQFDEGMVTGFFAYVQEYFPIRFQIWRQFDSTHFMLIGEKRVVPANPLGVLEVGHVKMLTLYMLHF